MSALFRDPCRRGAFEFLARALALAVLSLLGTGYALPALHFAAVDHDLCPEHGELEHVDSRQKSAHAASSRSNNPAIGEATLAEHAHDVCSAWMLGAQAADGAGARGVEVPDSRSDGVLSRVVEASAKSSVGLLHYAPKLAPPV